jgi:hypothetical protein
MAVVLLPHQQPSTTSFFFDCLTLNIKTNSKVNFNPEQDVKARRGVEVHLYSFLNLGAGYRWVINTTPQPLYPSGLKAEAI